jgi:hypothetical protein
MCDHRKNYARPRRGVPPPEFSGTNLQTLEGPWILTFPAGSGAPQSISMPVLQPLNLHEDFNVRHFSGTVTYRTTFSIESPGMQKTLWLDLGRINVTAEVKVNQTIAGSLWKPPYRLPIGRLSKPGANILEIKVTCLWPNRLIGDEHLPEENAYDPHGPVKLLPAWYRSGAPKPGTRSTFSTWHHYGKDDPLLQSGLTGPVRIYETLK